MESIYSSASNTLETVGRKSNKPYISDSTWTLIEAKHTAGRQRHFEEEKRLQQLVKIEARKDKKKQTIYHQQV